MQDELWPLCSSFSPAAAAALASAAIPSTFNCRFFCRRSASRFWRASFSRQSGSRWFGVSRGISRVCFRSNRVDLDNLTSQKGDDPVTDQGSASHVDIRHAKTVSQIGLVLAVSVRRGGYKGPRALFLHSSTSVHHFVHTATPGCLMWGRQAVPLATTPVLLARGTAGHLKPPLRMFDLATLSTSETLLWWTEVGQTFTYVPGVV